MSAPTCRALLDEVAPFCYLSATEKDRLAGQWVSVDLVPGQTLFEPQGVEDSVWFVESGDFVLGTRRVRPLQVFGERQAVLALERDRPARAVSSCRLWRLGVERLLEWLRVSPVLAREIGRRLREDQGIFHPLEAFTAEVKRSLLAGSLSIPKLLRLYLPLKSALHPLATEDRLDTGALSYVVRRLPTNVCSTPSWYLTDEVPAEYRPAEELFNSVESPARRRGVWELFPGKNLVVIRNGLTDALDLVSCLCAFAVEARKIRRRVTAPAALGMLHRLRRRGPDPQRLVQDLRELGFSAAEADCLIGLWGDKVFQRLWELVLLHEDIGLVAQKQTDIYHGRRTERWVAQILGGAERVLGLPRDLWPEELEVYLISSNTHSVTNCLSPAVRRLKPAVMDWAREQRHPFLDLAWKDPEDLFYALLWAYQRANPRVTPDSAQEEEHGILRLIDTTATGIQAQVIAVHRLDPCSLDPALRLSPDGGPPRLIVNIDYAFGEQAEEILRGLIPGFCRHLRGFSVIGKAGSLVGRRGDILVPTGFLNQRDDRLFPLPPPVLEGEVGGRAVHRGLLLTVEGTLLQNRPMLHFYRNVHQIIGLEMEGYHFAQEIEHHQDLGLLRRDLRQSFFYYVSDLPLEAGLGLSRPLEGPEGVPPLYALTRRVLQDLLPT